MSMQDQIERGLAFAPEAAGQTIYRPSGSGGMLGSIASSLNGPDGDLASIINRLEQITAGVATARRVLEDKGDQVFGPIPTACANTAGSISAPGGIATIHERLDNLSSEVDSLNHSARRFERL